MTRIAKDCFGTIIATLSKMKECVRCELLADCRSINWQARGDADAPVVVRRPAAQDPPMEAPAKEGPPSDAASRAG